MQGYIIWSPYDDDKWSEYMWNAYVKSHKKLLFTKNIYVIKKGKFESSFYASEESKEINTEDILSIDLIKLDHDGYKDDTGIRGIPFVMAKYSETNKPVAVFCKLDDSVRFGWYGCMVDYNNKYTEQIIKKRFHELIRMPLKSLNKNKLILINGCID